MRKPKTTIGSSLSKMVIGSFCFILLSCGEKSKEGMIIFTQSQIKTNNVFFGKSDSSGFASRAQIMELNPERPETTAKILTGKFYSAHSPKISYDGRYMLFAAQQKQNDLWQIWEMDLNDLKSRQVTSSKENCTDPAYLPLGRIVFSKYFVNDTLKGGHSLYTCNTDGSNVKRITFNPHTYLASSVLNDGRVLTISRQVFPEQGVPVYMVLRPDGTKAELFYKGAEGTNLYTPALETNNGKIVFIESGTNNPGEGNLISINYNNPLHSREILSSEIKGDFHFIFPQKTGSFLVSYRKSESERYALYEFDPEKKTLGKPIYSNNDFDVLEVVATVKQIRPRKLPSEVNDVIKTGLIMCQDVNVYDDPIKFSGALLKKVSKVEIMGTDSSMGAFKPSRDGSFYLKVVADKPFQIWTYDEGGNVIRKCDWIWLRPNERRGCVGCHEDRDIVPDNRISHAVKKAPLGIPVHLSKLKEKMIDTE